MIEVLFACACIFIITICVVVLIAFAVVLVDFLSSLNIGYRLADKVKKRWDR